MNHSGSDYYSILELPPNATHEQIRAAYRRLSKKYHPDRHQMSELADLAEAQFKLVQEAYKVLGNAESRRRYDQERSRAGTRGSSGTGFDSDADDMSRAIDFMNRGRFLDALDILRAAVAADPASSDLNHYTAICYMELERWSEALPFAEKASSLDADDPDKVGQLGIVLHHLGQWSRAIQQFRRATNLDPREPEWWAWLAISHSSAGQYYEAGRAVDRLRTMAPSHPVVVKYDEQAMAEARQSAAASASSDDSGECMRLLGGLLLGMICGGGC